MPMSCQRGHYHGIGLPQALIQRELPLDQLSSGASRSSVGPTGRYAAAQQHSTAAQHSSTAAQHSSKISECIYRSIGTRMGSVINSI
eukprot:COSAG06_NODE_449_length_15623_cov_50.097204_9_plen_87_part_00